jgi:HPt (histidine-containing phosphotransfer) domain-containing protein
MNDHVGKPIDVRVLHDTLGFWLQRVFPVDSTAVTGATGTSLPDIEGLDLRDALARMGGNEALLRNLLASFADSQGDIVERIYAALLRNDPGDAERPIHTFKGLVGHIGAHQLQVLAGQIEEAVHQQAPEPDLRALLNELDALLQPLTQTLRTLAPARVTAPEDAGPGLDGKNLERLMSRLADMLESGDADATDLIEQLAATRKDHPELLSSLANAVRQYDFDLASHLLQDYAGRLGVTIRGGNS